MSFAGGFFEEHGSIFPSKKETLFLHFDLVKPHIASFIPSFSQHDCALFSIDAFREVPEGHTVGTTPASR